MCTQQLPVPYLMNSLLANTKIYFTDFHNIFVFLTLITCKNTSADQIKNKTKNTNRNGVNKQNTNRSHTERKITLGWVSQC